MTLQHQWKTRSKSADWSRELTFARGRGARSNASGRYERRHLEPFEDGWSELADDLPPLRTELIKETPRTAITYNSSPDIPSDRSINPYKGCEHGCIYCFARPNHTYRGLSAGLDFESKIFVKPGLPEALRKDLAKPGYKPAPVMLAGDTDAYQPIEKDLKLTRSVLEILSEHNHPVTIVTKSAMILRDMDILASMAERDLVSVAISLTTLDRHLARTMEPRASAPHRRLQAIQQLATMGVPVSVLTAPLIPALNDGEIEKLLETASDAGARHAGFVMLRLPNEIEQLFKEWLEEHFPDRAKRVMHHIQDMHGGKAYSGEFFTRQRGKGPYAQLIADRFHAARKRFGLDGPFREHRTDLFSPPVAPPTSLDDNQLSLFEFPVERDQAA